MTANGWFLLETSYQSWRGKVTTALVQEDMARQCTGERGAFLRPHPRRPAERAARASGHPAILSSGHPFIRSSCHWPFRSSGPPVFPSSRHPVIPSSIHQVIRASCPPGMGRRVGRSRAAVGITESPNLIAGIGAAACTSHNNAAISILDRCENIDNWGQRTPQWHGLFMRSATWSRGSATAVSVRSIC
jgi:hypothetical protein